MSALKRTELLRWAELDEERLALGRRVAAIEKEQSLIKPKILDVVRADGVKGVLSKWGYHLMIEMVRAAPKWKDEFIKITSAEAAMKVAGEQPEREKLTVTKVA